MRKSKTYWIPVDSIARTDYVLEVERSYMQFSDGQMNVAGLGVDDAYGFIVKSQPSRPMPYQDSWINSLTFEVSSDRQTYYRQVYSILDFFSDVGGLFGAVSPIFIVIVSLTNLWGQY